MHMIANVMPVVISTLTSAHIVYTITLVFYVFGFLPAGLLNVYDRQFMKVPMSPLKIGFFRALANTVLPLSDTQILQGIAVLVAAFINIGSMSVYDWQMVIYLAWSAMLLLLKPL